MEGLTFRNATAEDTRRIAEIMYSEPPEEAVRVAGSVDGARAMGFVMVREGMQGWQRSVLGVMNDEPLVVLQAGSQFGGIDVTPGLLFQALKILGPVRAIRALPWLRALRRVNPKAPADSYYIAELHTHPEQRNRGLGGALLDYAEVQAREEGHQQMSLITTVVNPARRLYERHGFRVVETRTDPTYARYTGIAGRYLMVKELP